MSDLLQEVDDALRAEKAEKFWKENGPYILSGAVLLVIMTGVFTAYNTWQMNRNVAQTALVVQAMQSPTVETSLEAAVKDLKGQHKAMAQLQIAGLKAQRNETAPALKLYQDIAADHALPGIWRDLATLNAARLEWNTKIDAARAKVLFDQVKPLTAKKNPWHMQAAIQAAMIAGDSLNDPKTAIELLRAPIEDPATPPSLKEKAKVLDHLYLNTSSIHKAEPQKAEAKG